MDGANELLQFAEKLEPQRKIFRQVEHKTKLTVEWKKRTKQNEVIGRRLLSVSVWSSVTVHTTGRNEKTRINSNNSL